MKKAEKILSILTSNGLKRTPARIAVLELYMASEYALSYFDLEERLKDRFNKSTLYRTQTSFLNSGLLHKIDDTSGILKYALKKNDKQHEHAHFTCHECEHTYCINTGSNLKLKIPDGFLIEETSLLIKGICNSCRH